MIVSLVLLVITIIYSAFIFWCMKGWKKNASHGRRSNISGRTIDVIIAIRNEEYTILRLLEQIFKLLFT